VKQTWLWFNGAALMFSLAHLFIDTHIGLFGRTSLEMSGMTAVNILLSSLIFGWWAVALGLAGQQNRAGLVAALALSFGWAFLGNGLVAFVAAPPPSAAFPYQDLAHFGSFVCGGLAAVATWREVKAAAGAFHWWLPGGAIVLTVMILISQGVLFFFL